MNYYTDVLKKYTVFTGRATRQEYWMFFLISIIISLVLNTLEGKMGLISTLYSLAVLLPSLAVAVRRLHDTGRSGWWLFLGLIPIVGIIVLIVFLVQDSEVATNEYGPNPKASVTTPPQEPTVNQ